MTRENPELWTCLITIVCTSSLNASLHICTFPIFMFQEFSSTCTGHFTFGTLMFGTLLFSTMQLSSYHWFIMANVSCVFDFLCRVLRCMKMSFCCYLLMYVLVSVTSTCLSTLLLHSPCSHEHQCALSDGSMYAQVKLASSSINCCCKRRFSWYFEGFLIHSFISGTHFFIFHI